MKLAIVHDWLTNMGGAEQVVINLKKIYPDAPIYTTFYNPDNLDKKLKNTDIKTSFLQRKKMITDHKKYFPLMPMAFEMFNLKKYDVILSSSTCCAKGAKKRKDAIHICYINTPMRYAYEYREEYTKNMSLIKKFLVNILLFFMRIWDKNTNKRIDYFISNSSEIQKRVKKTYGRDSVVINPPVRCDLFNISETNKDYYFIVSRLVPYKRFDLAVQACHELGKKLIIIGDGTEKEKLKKIAKNDKNIIFMGRQPDDIVKKYMSECKALLFPGLEDFGITPVEAMACGRPVICYGKGGVLDTVIDGKTGVYFNEQTVEDLKNAINKFETLKFNKEEIRNHALKFDEKIFQKKIKTYIEEKVKKNNVNEKKIKIAIDARMINSSGIGTYIQNLMKNNCYDIALGNRNEIEKINNNIEIIEYDSKIYGIKEQFKFPYKKLKKEKVDFLHIPHYNVPIFYRGKMIVTIHDLTHLVFPQFLPNKFAYFYAKIMIGIAIKKAYKVITNSENTKKDILKFYKVNPDKIKVIYLGVGKEFQIKEKNEIQYLYEKFKIPMNKKILMYVGNLKPHKNLERLLEAYSKINNIDETRLLLVGKAFEKYNTLEEKEKLLGISNNVIHTGIVTQKELIDLYNLTDLFVFPSLYEGFGLPILEALACGTPVICSNNSSIPEVGKNIVEYFDAYNIEEIKNKIEENINKKIDNKKVKEFLEEYEWEETSNMHKEIFKYN